MRHDANKGGVLAAVLRVLSCAMLLGILVLLGWVAWRIFGGDPAVPLGTRAFDQVLWLFAFVPMFLVAVFTFIARGLLTGTLKPAGGTSDFDNAPTGSIGSGIGSMHD
jgi:TRAP-type C4-dicarboxylate transport system permease small subunit